MPVNNAKVRFDCFAEDFPLFFHYGFPHRYLFSVLSINSDLNSEMPPGKHFDNQKRENFSSIPPSPSDYLRDCFPCVFPFCALSWNGKWKVLRFSQTLNSSEKFRLKNLFMRWKGARGEAKAQKEHKKLLARVQFWMNMKLETHKKECFRDSINKSFMSEAKTKN